MFAFSGHLTDVLRCVIVLCVPPSPLITKREAADILGVTPSSVHRMIDRRELVPADQIMAGDKIVAYLFRESDVRRLAKARTA